ncbi:MAG: tRNA (N(6)-L-threonylcarbamoyladenosine(37)-C(2))-methylthiotransferase MtaB, partial [Bacteroidales bacterium]|nr:tRNA (N(6)-L-threonylcarbamoyladenosine(37)-C(2))-methylthiotransferase MtaB [Bacteroidales bacterium]
LKEMGRRYNTAAFADKISYIRNRMETPGRPLVFFGIDVIAGFPGETEELFMETYNFLKDVIKPAFIHVFPYSRRPGTPAAARKDQVQDSIKTRRVQMLEELSGELHEAFIRSNAGIKEQVLFESTDKNGMMQGYTGNYIRISRPYDPAMIGKIIDVTI